VIPLKKWVNKLAPIFSNTNKRITPVEFNPLNPNFVNDPYPVYQILREQDPVHKSAIGAWVLTSYDDVTNALKDDRLGNAPSSFAVINFRNQHRYVCADVANNIIPFMDPPKHTQPRKLISKAFFEQLKNYKADLKSISDTLLDECKSKKEFDVLKDYATPYSIAVISRILGVPKEDEALLKNWSEWFFYLFTYIPSEEIRIELDKNLNSFRDYFSSLIEKRRIEPKNDFISMMLTMEKKGDVLTNAELIDNCMLLYSDGVENVDRGIANAVYALFMFPEQLKCLRQQPVLIANAVDECLRYESPAQYIGRIAQEDLVIRDKVIKKNEAVLLILGAANRDPLQFDEPDTIDLLRDQSLHLSFGKGRHSCIGAQLVKLEMETALLSLLTTFPAIKLKTTKPKWIQRLGHRWMEELNIEI
jgi:pimeloyl-[acyl-carrier protein] synthase